MSFSVKKIKDTNFQSIFYETPKKVNSYYQSSIEYQMNGRMKPLMIQTPHCINLSDFSEDKKYLTIELEITPELYDFFINIDEYNAEKAFINSKEWFKQDIPKDIIDDYYKPSVKPVKENANPKLKVKIPYFNGQCQTKIYDNRKNIIELKDIPVGSNILLILHINAVRFLKQNFYTDIYVTQIKVCYKKDDFTIPNVCIVDDVDGDGDQDNEFNVEDLIDSENIQLDEPELDNQEADNQEADNQEPDNLEPDNLEPDNLEPDNLEPENQEADNLEPDNLEPEILEPEILEPDNLEPEKKEPENQDIIHMVETPNLDFLEKPTENIEEVKLKDAKKEKIERKLAEAQKEFQYACNIFKQSEELVDIKNKRIKELEEKLHLFK
jgi:hypothetical protein